MKRVAALFFILILFFVSGCSSAEVQSRELYDAKNYIAEDLFEEENIPVNTSGQNGNIKASFKPSADIVYITRTGIKYHKYGCRYLKKVK